MMNNYKMVLYQGVLSDTNIICGLYYISNNIIILKDSVTWNLEKKI